MKKTKSFISLLLAAIMVLSVFSVSASAAATPITGGSTKNSATNVSKYETLYSSSIDKAKEEDWYKFTTVSADSFYTIYYANDSLATGTPYYDYGNLNIYLYDSYNKEIKHTYVSLYNEGSFNIRLETSSVYYIKFVMGGDVCNNTGNYKLKISKQADDNPSIKEEAVEVSLNQSYKKQMDGIADEDWFKIKTLSKDAYYTFTLKNNSISTGTPYYDYGNLNVYVYDMYNKEVAHSYASLYGESSFSKRLDTSSTYHFVIKMGGDVIGNTGNYEFKITYKYDNVPNEKESAVSAPVNMKCTYSLDGPNDVDYFTFKAPATATYKFVLNDSSIATGTPYYDYGNLNIYLYDSFDKEIGHSYSTLNGTSSIEVDLTKGSTYYFKILAGGDIAGNTGNYDFTINCDAVKTTTISIPSITLTNVASSGKIKISWNAVSGAKEYKVYRATSSGGTYKLMKTTSSTSYTNTSATAGKTYYYKVRAVASDGTLSKYSSVKSRTCDLAKPVVTSSNVSSSGKIKLKWDKVEGATSYKVYRATSKSGTYKLMKTTTSTSYTNTSATAGKTYYYKVKAVCSNSAADSAYSSIITRTCDLAKPTNVQFYFNSSNKPVVKWSKVDGATSYKVYRATSQNGTYKLMKTTTSTSYTNTSISHGTTYYYKVKAVCSNSAADSAYSAVVGGYVK